MTERLNLVNVFIISKVFLSKYYFDSKYSIEMLIIINGFMINKCKDNWQQEPQTWDPSVWIDWMQAAKEVLQLDIADIETSKNFIDEYQAYLIMKLYVHNFAYESTFDDVIQLFKLLNIDKERDLKKSKIWKNWMLSVNSFLENKLTKDDSLVSLSDLIVSNDQTYNMMELFLENYCLKSDDKEISLFLQNVHNNRNTIDSSFYQNWITIYKEICVNNNGNNISVIQAYNVMKIFLEQNLCNELNQDCLNKFRVRKHDQTPRDDMIWYDWLHVAYKVLLPC